MTWVNGLGAVSPFGHFFEAMGAIFFSKIW